MGIYCFMLTRGECAPQHNSLLPANHKDVLAHVQQRSLLIFHQHCSGDVSHSLLQWHWASPGEHTEFFSTPSLVWGSTNSSSAYVVPFIWVFCFPDNHHHFSQWLFLAFNTESQQYAAGCAHLGCGCQKAAGILARPTPSPASKQGWSRT